MKSLFDLVKPLLWYVAVIGVVVYGFHLNRQDGYDEGYTAWLSPKGKPLSRFCVKNTPWKSSSPPMQIWRGYASSKTKTINWLASLRTPKKPCAKPPTDSQEILPVLPNSIAAPSIRRPSRCLLLCSLLALSACGTPQTVLPPEPLPAAVFTTGFVRVWNAANGITPGSAMPTPNGSGRTPAPASGTGTADDLDSGVTQEQLLTNQVRNGELYGICRAQLKDLINWTRNESK
ncbi:hypothetical protein AO268_04190 [Pseudomonas sp. ICMP 8385]|uniref:hypothetical protein n=1 Tax=Pseudomonas sp. ICMP 8385 TaxID=1718920 RepID=UPI000C0A1F34|nr:hypothetical protein [Pseudomonas sp. ICMP 8385]PHN55645.1 hypothetical protein AO268_04190 [Pseudomonas sp. ICMP 8385]